MNQKEMIVNGAVGRLCAVYAAEIGPILFRVRFNNRDCLFYEIDNGDFSEAWLTCCLDRDEVQALERGLIDVRSLLDAHRWDSQIIYHHYDNDSYSDGTNVWDIKNDVVWYKRLLPQLDNWKLNKHDIRYYLD